MKDTEKKMEKEEKTEKVEKKGKKEVEIKESPIRKNAALIGNYLLGKIKDYRYVMALDFVIFLLLFFLIPVVILKVKPVIWMVAFALFTILPTIAVYWLEKFRDKQIMFGFFFIYLLIFIVLKRCTLIDLYGITSHGELDHTAPWLDAVFVTCIIVFFQYLGILLVDFLKGNKKKKKVVKKKKVKK